VLSESVSPNCSVNLSDEAVGRQFGEHADGLRQAAGAIWIRGDVEADQINRRISGMGQASAELSVIAPEQREPATRLQDATMAKAQEAIGEQRRADWEPKFVDSADEKAAAWGSTRDGPQRRRSSAQGRSTAAAVAMIRCPDARMSELVQPFLDPTYIRPGG
jgi:hypothetical protein